MNKIQDPDRLQEIWNRQLDFQRNFVDFETMTSAEKILFTKDNVLSAHRELSEVLSSIPSKSYRAESAEYDVKHVQEEIVDVMKFVMNVALTWGLTADSFTELFMHKSDVVQSRFDSEKHNITGLRKTNDT